MTQNLDVLTVCNPAFMWLQSTNWPIRADQIQNVRNERDTDSGATGLALNSRKEARAEYLAQDCRSTIADPTSYMARVGLFPLPCKESASSGSPPAMTGQSCSSWRLVASSDICQSVGDFSQEFFQTSSKLLFLFHLCVCVYIYINVRL